MSQQANNEFDAAKAIVDALTGLDPEQQERAIRFAGESVGLQTPGPKPAAAIAPATHLTADQGEAAFAPHRHMDIKEFTGSKAPKSDQQFAAVVAYYYRFEAPIEKRKDAINAEDLNTAARLVGRKRPANASYTLANAKNAGYLDAAGKGTFQINSVGENLVAITLPGNATEAASRSNDQKIKKKTKRGLTKKQSRKNDK